MLCIACFMRVARCMVRCRLHGACMYVYAVYGALMHWNRCMLRQGSWRGCRARRGMLHLRCMPHCTFNVPTHSAELFALEYAAHLQRASAAAEQTPDSVQVCGARAGAWLRALCMVGWPAAASASGPEQYKHIT
jgi:hypothetical protein